MARVNVYCRVYNVKPYLEQCISSVLTQTYSEFEFFLTDNGCTDGSSEILDAFAAKDPRIHLTRFEKNTNAYDSLFGIIEKTAEEYVAIIDSDDWWEPEHLERLLSFAEQNDLDIACTGSYCYKMPAGKQEILRSVPTPIVVERSQMAVYFPVYHVFFRTYWGKLFRAEVLPERPRGEYYGGDTFFCFDAIRSSKRIGVDNSILYNYRIRQESISGFYSVKRFLGDVQLQDDAFQFLCLFGIISPENKQFLRAVFSNAILDTVRTLNNSSLSPVEKAREFRKISEHPYTRDTYQNGNDVSRSHDEVTWLALKTGQLLKKGEFEDIQATLQALLPRCGKCVTFTNLALFFAEKPMMNALIQDDRDTLGALTLAWIQAGRYTKQYDLGHLMQSLAGRNSLLKDVNNAVFIRNYPDIYRMIWQGQTTEALEEMTGLLLERRINGARKAFLQLYLNLAAQLEEIPAFIFGKVRLAELYFQQGQQDLCRNILLELAEMGVEENDDIKTLWSRLSSSP